MDRVRRARVRAAVPDGGRLHDEPAVPRPEAPPERPRRRQRRPPPRARGPLPPHARPPGRAPQGGGRRFVRRPRVPPPPHLHRPPCARDRRRGPVAGSLEISSSPVFFLFSGSVLPMSSGEAVLSFLILIAREAQWRAGHVVVDVRLSSISIAVGETRCL